jgi:hypothetical protein
MKSVNHARYAVSLVFGALFFSQQSTAQVEVKNGGDVVNCVQAADSIFSGPYLLDYLATYHTYSHSHEADIKYPLEELRSMLLIAVPEVGRDFDRFVGEYNIQTDEGENPQANHIWRGSNNRLISIKDEELNLLSALDKNCYSDFDQGIIDLSQVVVRQDRQNIRGFIYNYDRSKLDTIKGLPWQESYLVVHEWLWNFVDHASSVREINAFLHSQEAAKMDSYSLRYSLANLGFKWSSLSGNLPGEVVEVSIERTGTNLKIRATPSPTIVGPDTKKVRFVNRSGYRLEIVFPGSQVSRVNLSEGDRIDSTEVIVEMGSNFRFPGAVAIEVQPMLDPIYDILLLDLLR